MIINERVAPKLLIRVTSDIQVRNINELHFDLLLLLQAAKTRRNSSLNTK